MANSTSGGASRGNSAKAMVADQISQAVQSTSNLIHLMQQSSHSQAPLSHTLLCSSFTNCNPIAFKYGKFPAQFSLSNSLLSRGKNLSL
ncbi:hypothetical protein FNV43_RR10208 [Rhamnella rubrinervis]|uniref:Uncharacterized protein n=1 Tax=Rhamnella rubrinervis TaxID=2594499 RepID=A0A8K0ML37_9ROSA|nr:hypothetical protein FNV43_RR10208 [Rhamnella rubrinervis]